MRRRLEALQEDPPLERFLPHVPQGVAEGMLEVEGPGGLDLFGDLPNDGEGDGRNARLVQHPLDQSHGLLTHGSGGHHQREIHLVLFEQVGYCRSGLLDQRLRHRDIAHEREMARAHAPDDPLPSQLP